MSKSWSHGYFTEIEYTRGVYREMSPANINLALLMKGVVMPDESQFTYIELGCGHGLSAIAIAAAYPNAKVIAIDINPGQIAGARAIVEAAGLKNIRFEEWSFADLLAAKTPSFDYVSAHGILSWVGQEQHQEIADIMREKLRPGGIAYLSYNSMPGWAPMLPIRRVMQEHAKRSSRPAVERVKDATNFIKSLQKANASVFKAMPSLNDRIEKMEDLAPAYLAHEYLNEHWIPFAFPEVVELLSGAKMSFAASATLSDHVDVTTMVEGAREIMNDISDLVFYETVRDIFVNQSFRRDLFTKGKQQMTPAEQALVFSETRFIAMRDAAERPKHFATSMAQLDLKSEIYDPLAAALAEGPISVGEILQRSELKSLTISHISQAMAILVGAGFAVPCSREKLIDEAQTSTAAVNRVLLEHARWMPDNSYLMSPITGTGVPVNDTEMLFLRHGNNIDDQVRGAVADLKLSNRSVAKDGKLMTEAAEIEAHVRERAELFREKRLPILTRLGIV